MAKSNKYQYQVIPDNATWRVDIIRRITSKKSVVSKSQTGFASETDADQWGQTELKTFLQSLSARNKRRAVQRKQG